MAGIVSRRLGLLLPVLMVLAIGYLVPMATIAWTSLHRAGHLSLAAYVEVLSSPTFLRILLRTLSVAAIVTAICVVAGYLLAYWAATRAHTWAGSVMALVMVPYLTSVLIRSYAWIAILGNDGLINHTLSALGLIETPLPLVFSATGTIVGMVHILLPMAVLPIYAGMRQIPPSLLLAARSLGGGSASVFVTVFLPLSIPGVVAGAALVCLSAIGFYVTPALLGAPGDYLVAQAIEVRVSTLAEFDVAAALAWLLLLLVGTGLILFRRRIVPLPGETGSNGAPYRHAGIGLAVALPRLLVEFADAGAWVLARLLPVVAIALLVFLLAPMLVVLLIAFSNAPYLTFPPPGYSWRWMLAFVHDGQWIDSMWFSLRVAAAAALTALAIGTPYALALTRGRFQGRRLLWLLAVSPMILPHIVIGLGFFFTAVAVGMNGQAASFWLAYTVIGLPYVVIILVSALARFDINLERAAVNLGASPLTAIATITVPILAASFASACLFAFLAGFDDLIISLFLSAPRGTTLAIRMWEDIRLEISPKTAVVGLLQVCVLLIGLAGVAIMRKLRRPKGLDPHEAKNLAIPE
jgi:putative spermidine/putrescine transport system permease protein